MSSLAGEPRVALAIDGRVATLTLSRPQIHNAFDEQLLAQLNDAAVRKINNSMINGWAICRSMKKAAVIRMMIPNMMDLVAAAPT